MRIVRKQSSGRRTAGLLTATTCIAAGFWLVACSAGPAAESEVVATIDGAPVTMAEVEEQIGDDLAQLDNQYRKQRRQLVEAGLDRAIRDRLLEDEAAARGISVEELIAAETRDLEVGEADVAAFYERNSAALGGGSFEDWAPRIREFLEENLRQRSLNNLGDSLGEGRDVVILLEPHRVELDNAGSPALGPADALVTLTEFSDFECPFCGRFFPTLKRLEEAYGDELRVVYRQYPLDSHPHAFRAAEASLCADDQGKFWEMHDLMFQEQDALDVESLVEKAGRLEMDVARFRACLDSGRHVEQIRRDIKEGDRLGIEGTPAIFVNGIAAPGGAAPYEVIAGLIDEELRRAGSR